METKAQRLPLLFLFVISLSTIPPTISLNDFEQWISWHGRNYFNGYRGGPNLYGGVMDPRLQTAEADRMEVRVSRDGNGDFVTIKEAVDSIPLPNNQRVVVIRIGPGVYREKLNVPKKMNYVTFVGNNAADPPTITGNDTASSTKASGGSPMRTFGSATVGVDGDYFTAINVRFENTAPHVVGSTGGQAVALRVSGTKAAFYNCSFYGSQDTLYDHKGLHYFNNCFVQGSVDFIFGYGTSLYENCYLNSVAKKVASVTAQKRSTGSSMSSGFSFKNCTVGGSGSLYLGRAWGDYSRVVFSYTFMDEVVLPQGWSNWGKTNRNQKVYYGEYQCMGPGSSLEGRVPWARSLTDEEAMPFLGTYYIDGQTWLINPETYLP